jgi:hypothetical protein
MDVWFVPSGALFGFDPSVGLKSGRWRRIPLNQLVRRVKSRTCIYEIPGWWRPEVRFLIVEARDV